MIRPTLKVIHAQAVIDLGQSAPAFVTLKRLSAAGVFDGLSGSAISDLLRGKYANRNAAPPAESKTQTVQVQIENPAQERVNQVENGQGSALILQRIASLESKLEAATTQIETMGAAVNQLNAVRNTLMSKYDAVASQRLDVIEALQQQIKKLNADSILTMEVGRMRGQLQLILEKLNRPA